MPSCWGIITEITREVAGDWPDCVWGRRQRLGALLVGSEFGAFSPEAKMDLCWPVCTVSWTTLRWRANLCHMLAGLLYGLNGDQLPDHSQHWAHPCCARGYVVLVPWSYALHSPMQVSDSECLVLLATWGLTPAFSLAACWWGSSDFARLGGNMSDNQKQEDVERRHEGSGDKV